MIGLALEYFALTFVASVGVLQLAAAYNGLRGISFFGSKTCGYILSFFTISPALAGLFTWNLRNPTGIIEGREQFYFFSLALLAALIFTLMVSSHFMKRRLRDNSPQHNGIDALRDVTFFQVLRHSWKRRK